MVGKRLEMKAREGRWSDRTKQGRLTVRVRGRTVRGRGENKKVFVGKVCLVG